MHYILILLALTLVYVPHSHSLTLNNGDPQAVAAGATFSTESGTTYYVRTGGSTVTNCTGLANVDYDGSGTGEACAHDSPYWAIGVNESTPLLQGGDTMIIADGDYMIGYGAPSTIASGRCSTAFAYGCYLNPIPSGTANRPTRILGEGYASGCATRPELWGTERVTQVLNLTNSSFIELQCLEITDKAECGLGKGATNFDVIPATGQGCNHAAYPHGTYGINGIFANNSNNVYMEDINIHGMGSNGISSGVLSNWEMVRVDISYNSQAGWNGDFGGTTITGYMNFIGGTVNWNGCMESKTTQKVILDASCVGQSAGNYSDGLGFNETGGEWFFSDMEVSYNVQDGIDLLYVTDQGIVIIENLIAIGNGGNAVKTGNSKSWNVVRDSTLIGNCTSMSAASVYWFNSSTCRAGGHPIAAAGNILIERTSIYVSGSGALLVNDRYGNKSNLDIRDSIVYLDRGYNIGNGQTQGAALGWNEETNMPSTWNFTNTLIYDTRGYLPRPSQYRVNGVDTVINTPCDLSTTLDPVTTGCSDPVFTEIPAGTDGPAIWNTIKTLTIDPASPFYGKPIGDYIN